MDTEERLSLLERAFAAHIMLDPSVVNGSDSREERIATIREWAKAYNDRHVFAKHVDVAAPKEG